MIPILVENVRNLLACGSGNRTNTNDVVMDLVGNGVMGFRRELLDLIEKFTPGVNNHTSNARVEMHPHGGATTR